MIISRPRRQQTIRYTGQPLLVNPPHGVLASQLQSLSRGDLCRLFDEGSRIFGFIRGHTDPREPIFVLYVGMVVDVEVVDEDGQISVKIILQHGRYTTPFILPNNPNDEPPSEAFLIVRIDGGFSPEHIGYYEQELRVTPERVLGHYPREIPNVSPAGVPQTDVVSPHVILPRVQSVILPRVPQVQPVIRPVIQPQAQPGVQSLNLPRRLEPALRNFQSAHPSLPEDLRQAGVTRGTLFRVFVHGDPVQGDPWTGTLGDLLLTLSRHLYAMPGTESDDVLLEFVALILGLRDLEGGPT